MLDFLETLERWTLTQRLLAGVGAYALLGALLVFGLVMPTGGKIDEQRVQQERLIEERAENRNIAENRDRWEESVHRLNEELAKAIKELPNEREIPELLRRISSIGKKIGLEFLLFQPLPEIKRDFYADVPVKLKVQGSFHEVATFFDRIGKLNRIVNIRNITLSDPGERSGKIILTIEGSAVTYRFLSEEEKASTGRRRR